MGGGLMGKLLQVILIAVLLITLGWTYNLHVQLNPKTENLTLHERLKRYDESPQRQVDILKYETLQKEQAVWK